MGIFRKHKINRYTLEELKRQETIAKEEVVSWCWNYEKGFASDQEFTKALHNWAEWREALARKENENESELDK